MDFSVLKHELINSMVQRPNKSGELSGHAAGEPFSDLVFSILINAGVNVKKQHDLLNEILIHLRTHSKENRLNAINSKSLREVLWKGRINKSWSITNQFDYKQSDFADMLVLMPDGRIHIFDVKTSNIRKKAQPPNIMSALRLAGICKSMLDTNEYEKVRISYIGISWLEEGDFLICKDVNFVDMLKITPSKLYINFTAALQIQFKLEDVDQSFFGTPKEWCLQYLIHYIESHKRRTETFYHNNVKPFIEVIDRFKN
jgi:hypothetical protein